MNKILWRYLIYFGIFICFVQIMESAPLQCAFAKVGLRMNFESLGTYAPLFLSALLIDITYRIGKRQNEIAEQQRKDMEYKIDRDLYAIVRNADSVINSFLLSCRSGIEWGGRSLKYEMERVKTAEEQINAIDIDVELRFPTKKGILSGYNLCFAVMYLVLDTLSDVVGDNGCKNFTTSDAEWIKATIEDKIDIILSGITDLDIKEKLKNNFEIYNGALERIKKNNLAQAIKEHILDYDHTRENKQVGRCNR